MVEKEVEIRTKVPQNIHALLKANAKKDRRSLANYVRIALEYISIHPECIPSITSELPEQKIKNKK